MNDLVAHTPHAGRWHPLIEHLRSTAERARADAEPFECADAAYWLGALHDIDKSNPAFQERVMVAPSAVTPRHALRRAWAIYVSREAPL